jgi:hypothetical protein
MLTNNAPPQIQNSHSLSGWLHMHEVSPGLIDLAGAASEAPASTGSVATAPASVPDCLSMSPDSLMAYCSSRLQSLDGQMQTIFTAQQTDAKVTQDLNQIATAMNDLPAPGSGSNPTVKVSGDDATAIRNAYQQAINDAQKTNPQLAASLKKDLDSFNSHLTGGAIPNSNVGNLTQNIKNYSSQINSDSELSMINLQSLMSQRETAIQLTTNLVQSLSQQTSDITKNIGQ